MIPIYHYDRIAPEAVFARTIPQSAVTEAVQARDAAAEVQVDLGAGEVRVASRLAAEQVLEAIREEGYSAELA